jgi:hypothetical protein
MYTKFWLKPDEMSPLRRPRRRWKDIIRMDFKRNSFVVEWIHLALDRDHWRGLVNTGSMKCGEFLAMYVTIRFSRNTLLHGVGGCT